MRVAIGQINATVADFEGNVDRMLARTREAKRAGADAIVFPELAVCGYPPMDLVEYDSFVVSNMRALRRLQHDAPNDIGVVAGYVDRTPERAGKALQNVAVFIENGRILHRQAKTLLPTYDVFDEARYFEPAAERKTFIWRTRRIGLAICEDIWWETDFVPGERYPVDPVRDLVDDGAEILFVPSASPFYARKGRIRRSLLRRIGRNLGVPVVYANMVGANDNLIFDGGSLATDVRGELLTESPGFEESLDLVEPFSLAPDRTEPELGERTAAPTGVPVFDIDYGEIEGALVLGIRDYLAKTGFSRVHLGLSGGIDSAVVAVLAARAVGPEHTDLFLLPSMYSSEGSVVDAERLAANLGITPKSITITPVYETIVSALAPVFGDAPPDVTEENIQARIRGLLLMAFSNKSRSLLLTTGNKSELAVGYATLYGDMCGSLAVIGDLLKTEVFALAEHLSRDGNVIPREIITKPPSAELRPDQRDQDSLPPYDVLDRILAGHIIRNQTAAELIADGFDRETVVRVLSLVTRAEYKRRQAPPVLKVSTRAFGTGRRIPLARAPFDYQLRD